MATLDNVTREQVKAALDTEVEQVLNPGEAQGFYRDTRECAALALKGGSGSLLLSPPAPRPKKR
ncbi:MULTISPECIES: hypothetical protein [Streptomyces]|uniref:Uncharacterized protein n=2 Tax=Streptomyces TaxID=1883 RepID=A0A117IWH2_9ACTN|nr:MULTISPECIES: hypothetical protein [Streptomyces]KUH38748.1 hypothetical protein ATE80_10730 [Streptomyces kanasensis]UUS34455.1 hypothetical protein NRO40_28945 [Streptomyces changanensis]